MLNANYEIKQATHGVSNLIGRIQNKQAKTKCT